MNIVQYIRHVIKRVVQSGSSVNKWTIYIWETVEWCINVLVLFTGSVKIIPLNNSETYVNGFLISDATELRTG